MDIAREIPDTGAGSASVLVVDDAPVRCKLFGAVLRRAGHRVRIAGDGREARALVAIEAPDLVLLDYMMPGLSGVDTLALLRAAPRTRAQRMRASTGLTM
jgi:CheY-like chemotaxis protein